MRLWEGLLVGMGSDRDLVYKLVLCDVGGQWLGRH